MPSQPQQQLQQHRQHQRQALRQLLVQLLLLLALVCPGCVSQQAETQLLDVRYHSIAVCPCDLTDAGCDAGCCCDTDCSVGDKTLFPCSGGHFYGNASIVNSRSCSTVDRLSQDHHPLTCVLLENYNALLGLYFPVQAKWTEAAVRSRADAVPDTRRFRSTSNRGLSQPATAAGRRGAIVPARTTTTPFAEETLEATARLALPARSGDGHCVRQAPVTFLAQPNAAACDVAVTAASCANDTELDFAAYLLDSSSTGVRVRNWVTGLQVPAVVSYLQLPSAAGYQKGLSGAADSAGTAVTPQRPTVAAAACDNAVVQVNYQLQWNGSSVTSVSATVLLASVSLNSVVTQRFASEWQHASAGSNKSVSSGMFGYDAGSPLLLGRLVGGVVITSSPGPQLPAPDASGACTSAPVTLLFPFDSVVHCRRELPPGAFADCPALAAELETELLDTYFGSDAVVGIFGKASENDTRDWLRVLRSADNSSADVGANATWANGLCYNLPTELVLTLLYAEQGKVKDASIWHVVGASAHVARANVSRSCGLGGCDGNTTLTFAARVRFVRVPAGWTPGQQPSIGDYRVDCWWGICWQELLYPLTEDFEGDSKARSVALALLLLALAACLCAVSRPWW